MEKLRFLPIFVGVIIGSFTFCIYFGYHFELHLLVNLNLPESLPDSFNKKDDSYQKIVNSRKMLYNKYGGITEWQQYRYYWGHNIKEIQGSQKYYAVNVKIQNKPESAGEVLVMKLKETYAGRLTGGGSSFTIRLYARDVMDMCYFADHFTGMYTIECPVYHGCNKVIVHLEYINFNAYRQIQDIKTTKIKIFTYDYCLNNTADQYADMHNCDTPEKRFEDDIFNIIHRKVSGEWHLGRVGCPNEIYHEKRPVNFCECQKRNNISLVMAGASHSRYNFDWLAMQCGVLGNNVARKHGDFFRDKFSFLDSKYMEQVIDKLQKTQKTLIEHGRREMPSNSFVIFKTGAWDLAFRGQKKFMDKLPKFINKISKLKKETFWAKSKFIFFTVYPFPHVPGGFKAGYMGYRNSFISSAANYYLRKAFVNIGVHIFDTHSLIMPRVDDICMRAHYICRDETGHIVGNVGKDFMSYFSELLCGYVDK